MTSDAKIGLLLGLAFIFIIAFILNGLPNFSKNENNNELTTNAISSQNNPPGIGAGQRKISREIVNQIRLAKKVQIPQMTDRQEIRFKAPLPESPSSVVKEAVKVGAFSTAQPFQLAKKKELCEPESNKSTLPRVYTVCEGDNLAVIAKKFYGPDNGNKRINITRLFEHNRKLLKSPDEIYQGQKLIIPPLSDLAENNNRSSIILASPAFERVESIGKRHLADNGCEPRTSKWYVVQEGDSLWRIAAKMLGNGGRYGEIAKLNSEILQDEDTLTVGMRLKIPAR
ncbi:MAG: hypothetical protein DRP62_04340 [Planctomycetota bacterium]|nr:MAG: hypothetical protein DRP62_04340 [Planctomycetota bacterium]